MAAIRTEPISLDRVLESVRADGDGAVALFAGTVRNRNRGRTVLRLEYEAYSEMAEPEMARIESEARQRFGVSRVLVEHRVGTLEIGEVSVVVVVASPHRERALAACAFVINELKRRVPLWKREHFEGGSVWIEGANDVPSDSRPAGDQPRSSSPSSSSSNPR